MVWPDWLIEHSVELASLVVSIIGFWVAGKYLININNNQKTSMGNNNTNSPQINVKGDNNKINAFKEASEKEVGIFGNVPLEKESSKEIIKKIENALDENKPVSLTARMCLRLARELKMKKDIEWFSKEIYGMKDIVDEGKEKGLTMRKMDIVSPHEHRGIEAEFNIQFGKLGPEKFPINIFISQPLEEIENWLNQDKTQGQISRSNTMIMWAPPVKLLIDSFKEITPETQVPYIFNKNSLQRILIEVKNKIEEFLGRAKEENSK